MPGTVTDDSDSSRFGRASFDPLKIIGRSRRRPMFQHAARINQARTAAGLSRTALAARIGVARSTVARWERNHGIVPTVGHLGRIALATGASLEWLATGRGRRAAGSEGGGPPAASDLVAQSQAEERLLVAFRSLSALQRAPMVDLLEARARPS
jgi:transcriptional regulator with XRE-family HTH domain